jgi:hypothetical protein
MKQQALEPFTFLLEIGGHGFERLDSPDARATTRRASTRGGHFPSPARLAGHSLPACPLTPAKKINSRAD